MATRPALSQAGLSTGVHEGNLARPAGLLVDGYVACEWRACGLPWVSADHVRISRDGLAWSLTERTGATEISGGSVGYIALGPAGKSQGVWTSSDGLSWQQGSLPSTAPEDNAQWGDVAAFASGIVITGVTSASCMGSAGLKTAAVWWSLDGTTWTREALPGALVADGSAISVRRISDGALVATQVAWTEGATSYSEKAAVWTTTDGRTWTSLKGGASIGHAQVLTNGSRCIVDQGFQGDDRQATLWTFDDGLNLVRLRQSGDLPWPWPAPWASALGPSGLLVTEDGTRFWLGVPTAS